MDTELIYWILGIGAAYFLFIKVRKDDDGRIEDYSVNLDMLVETLEEFEAKTDSNSKEGFTEASIQKQLFNFLNEKFVHVNREQGIEGINGLRIDFEVANKIGVEVKLARALFKTATTQRLVGQMRSYTNNKYGSNLIVAVFGTEEEAKQRVALNQIKEMVQDEFGAKYVFCRVVEPRKSKKESKAVDK